MKVTTSQIIEKSRELSRLIESHPVTINYKRLHKEMQNDKKAKDLLARLVLLGQETTEKISRGEEPAADSTWENTVIKEELEKNELVKKYILAQREYLDLITAVTNKIKDPHQ